MGGQSPRRLPAGLCLNGFATGLREVLGEVLDLGKFLVVEVVPERQRHLVVLPYGEAKFRYPSVEEPAFDLFHELAAQPHGSLCRIDGDPFHPATVIVVATHGHRNDTTIIGFTYDEEPVIIVQPRRDL